MSIRQNILQRILNHLEMCGVSRRAFCLSVGIDHRTVQIIERNGSVNLRTLEKIEQYLELHSQTLPDVRGGVMGKVSENFPTPTEKTQGEEVVE